MVLYPQTFKFNRLLISPSMLKRENSSHGKDRREMRILLKMHKEIGLWLGEWLSNAD